MTQGLNKVMIIGNLGREPEMRYTPGGRSVSTFTIATSRKWTGKDNEDHTETEWFNVVAWGNLAEICKRYLTKGMLVYIEGRLQTRHWEDNEGNQQKSFEIIAKEMVILNNKQNELIDA